MPIAAKSIVVLRPPNLRLLLSNVATDALCVTHVNKGYNIVG